MPSFLRKQLPADRPHGRQEGARFALLTFTAINLLNFMDRYVPSSVKELVQEDLHLTDPQTSLPVTGMVVVYMIFSVLFGLLADKDVLDRRLILAGAVAFWSFATAVAGLAQNLVQLVAFRSLVGVGEAAYMAIAPVMISDFYPPSDRNMAFTIFGLAMPVGGAMGYAAGSSLGSRFGWRLAFLACGVPGLLVSVLILFINNPARGVNDGDGEQERSEPKEGTLAQDFWSIVSNPAYAFATAGMVATSFAVGGFADWYEVLLVRRTDTTLSVAGLVLGAATAIGGIVGSLMGSMTAQFFEPRLKSSYFVIPGLFTLPGAALAFVAVNLVEMKYLAYACIILGQACIFTYTAPLSALSLSVIPVHLRARSAGMQVFFAHVLGDVISPPIVGYISEKTGSLQFALQISWIMILVSGLWWLAGGRCLEPLPPFGSEVEQREATLASLLCSGEEGPHGKRENSDNQTSDEESMESGSKEESSSE